MRTYNEANERVKHGYFKYLLGARGRNAASIDSSAKALKRFEVFTGFLDFKKFRHEQAESFKRHLHEQKSERTGEALSIATIHSTMNALREFFFWLAREPGYQSRIKYSDAEYFRVSMKEARIATARRIPRFPSVDQVVSVLRMMPAHDDIAKRDRAVFAFTLLTGARDAATTSFKLGDLDMKLGLIVQDARHARTKFSKTFITVFYPVGQLALEILHDYVEWLRNEKQWTDFDPLFPATFTGRDETVLLRPIGLSRTFWRTTSPIRRIFKNAFALAGLPYFNPHSIRHTLAHLGQTLCRTAEQSKAWSQNMGHESTVTTSVSYGSMTDQRQMELMHLFEQQELEIASQDTNAELTELVTNNKALFSQLARLAENKHGSS